MNQSVPSGRNGIIAKHAHARSATQLRRLALQLRLVRLFLFLCERDRLLALCDELLAVLHVLLPLKLSVFSSVLFSNSVSS